MRITYLTICLAVCIAPDAAAQRRVGPAGGTGGEPFEDRCERPSGALVWSDSVIHAVQLLCRNASGGIDTLPKRGGPGGTRAAFLMGPLANIGSISGRAFGPAGPVVHSLLFRNDRGTASRTFGEEARALRPFYLSVPRSEVFAGWYGTAGQHLVSLGVLTVPRPAADSAR